MGAIERLLTYYREQYRLGNDEVANTVRVSPDIEEAIALELLLYGLMLEPEPPKAVQTICWALVKHRITVTADPELPPQSIIFEEKDGGTP